MNPKNLHQQQLWAEAKRRCRLSDEALRMARELGLNPRSLIKNIPSPKQRWKAPVDEWVRVMYEKRHRRPARRASNSTGATPEGTASEP